MNRHILAIATIFATSGVTAADGISSRFVYGDAAPTVNAPIRTNSVDYPSNAFGMMPNRQDREISNDRYGDRAPSSIVANPATGMSYSLTRSIGTSGLPSVGTSPRMLYGSN